MKIPTSLRRDWKISTSSSIKAVTYEEGAEEPNLSGFLEEVALVADIDSVEDGDNRVLLMTLHSAKGLEFPYVYLAGMEDGLFPSYMSIAADDPTEGDRRGAASVLCGDHPCHEGTDHHLRPLPDGTRRDPV